MSIPSHGLCDQCEKKMIPLDDRGVTEETLLEAGWVTVSWSEEDEEGFLDKVRDFCSFECAGKWCSRAKRLVSEERFGEA